MTLKYIGDTPVLTHCPACGHHWPVNYKGDTQRWKHLSEHDPEDFGLSPIGESSERAERPLWDDPWQESGGDQQ